MAEKEAWSKNKLSVNKLGYPCLTYSKALEYINAGFSCLFEVEMKRQVGLPPRYIGQIDSGIRETLDSDLLRYSEELSGIIVCYKHVQCLDTSGCILDETPFLYFNIRVKYIIFRPQVGEKLKGVVNKVGHGHYGCIVHECFNASVHKIKVDPSKQTNKQLKRISNIDVGSEFVFRITRFDIHNDILSIKGKIADEDFSNIRNQKKEKSLISSESVNHTGGEKGEIKHVKKKKKKSKGMSMANGETIALTINSSDQSNTPMSGSQNEIKEEQVIDEQRTESKLRKKKSKRRHSLTVQNIKIEKETDDVIDNIERVLPKKKRKLSKVD